MKKELWWIASSKKDLMKFPKGVQDEAIFGLDLAREGDVYDKAKPLKGFGSAGVLELVLNNRAGTFRVVYTIKLENAIYVLHAFQKKSKSGIKTPKQEIDLIHNRLQQALSAHRERVAKKEEK